jgi:hypothetical protein
MTLNGHVILNAANYDNYAPSRLRRSDGGVPYYLQHKWSATPSLWRLDGYKSDGAFHAGVEVARADSAKNVDSVPWTSVTGAPATYAPSAHTHDLSNASVNYATNAGSAGSVAWTGVTGAPATYAPSAHAHDYAATNHTHDYAAASHTHNKLYSRNLDANYTIEAEWDNGPGRGWRLNGYYQGNFHDGFGVKYADSVTDPGSSKLLTGYVKLPGSGLIIQWGRWAIGDIQIDLFGNITFPIAFPNSVFQVNTTLYSHNREAFDSAVAVTGHSPTGFDWTIQEWSGLSQNLGMAYIAIGY